MVLCRSEHQLPLRRFYFPLAFIVVLFVNFAGNVTIGIPHLLWLAGSDIDYLRTETRCQVTCHLQQTGISVAEFQVHHRSQ